MKVKTNADGTSRLVFKSEEQRRSAIELWLKGLEDELKLRKKMWTITEEYMDDLRFNWVRAVEAFEAEVEYDPY